MTTVDLAPRAVAIVMEVLARYVPDREVRVMGSRSAGRAKPFSDLDLVVMGEEPLPLTTRADLRDAFDEADVPCSVDLIEWASTSDEFRRVITTQSRPFRAADSDPAAPQSVG